MNGNINIRNIRTRITPERTRKIIGYQFGAKFKLVFCAETSACDINKAKYFI
jgi:hypothetical protein